MNTKNALRFYSYIFLVFILAFYCIKIQAQENSLRFENISVDDGLSQSTVFSITQDSKGFMWFGTRTGGLNKYDGYSFKTFKDQPKNPFSISGNEILKIFEDSKGRIWIGTRGFGVNRFDYEKERFYNYLNLKTPNNRRDYKTVPAIVEDYKGRIWIATLGSLCLFNEKTDCFVPFTNNRTGYEFTGSSTLCLINDSILCIGNKKGVHLFNTNTKEVIKEFQYQPENTNSISSNRVNALFVDSKDRLWVGTRNDGLNLLKNISDSSFIRFQYDFENNNSISNNVIRVISEDKRGNIWIGTSGGLNKLTVAEQNKSNPTFIRYKNNADNKRSLSQNVIFSFFEDDRGDFWIGTWSSGLDYVNTDSKKFEHFQYNKDKTLGLYNNNVTCFTENNLGIWVGTDNGGISLFDRENRKFIKHIRTEDHTNIILNNHIRSLYSDGDNSIWIGTFKGLSHYNTNTQESKIFFENNMVNAIVKGENNFLWIGTGKGLFKFDKTNFSYKKYERNDSIANTLIDNTINYIHIDSDKKVWIGTKRGLHLYDEENDNFILFAHSPANNKSLSNDNVITIANDKNGNLWIGTYNGLNKYNPADSSFSLFSENNGFPDNVINGIVQGNKGELWLSTIKGLIEFRYLTGVNNDSIIIRHFTEKDGLQGDEFIRHSQFKTKNGEILFGGLQGFNIFNPDSIKSNLHKPKVVLTDLKLFNHSIHVDDETGLLKKHVSLINELTFTYKQSVVTFCFAALNYTSPERNKFAYKLEGFEKNWNYVGHKNEATYTSLPSGEYIFRVKASNNDGIWNEEGTSIKITILPPWWKTWVFRISIIIFLLIFIAGVYLYRVRTLQQQKNDLEIKIRERTAELHDANTELEEKHEEIVMQKESIQNQNTELESQKNKLEKAYNSVEVLSKIGKEIIISLSVEEIIDITYQKIHSMIDFSLFSIGLFNEKENSLVYKNAKLNGQTQDDFEYKLNDTSRIGVWSFNNQESILITDIKKQHKKYLNQIAPPLFGEQYNSIVYIPLNVKDKRIGVISIQSTKKNLYTKYHQDILENIGIYTAIALDNADAYDKIEQQTQKLITINVELHEQQYKIQAQNEELRVSEEEQSQLNEELITINNQLITQRTELEDTIAQLKNTQSQLLHAEKMASIGILTAGVAHEINNPLNFIHGGKIAIEDYVNEFIPEHSNELSPLINIISTGIDRAIGIIKSLNRFNRKSDKVDEECDIELIINNCITILQNRYKNKINVVKNFTKAPYLLRGNEGEIHQMVLNILTNAEQAIKKDSGTVKISSIISENYLELEFTDDGIGIPKENIQRVTEPFFTTKIAGEGTGLGLSIVYSIIKRHKGELQINSTQNKGTSILIKLPIANR